MFEHTSPALIREVTVLNSRPLLTPCILHHLEQHDNHTCLQSRWHALEEPLAQIMHGPFGDVRSILKELVVRVLILEECLVFGLRVTVKVPSERRLHPCVLLPLYDLHHAHGSGGRSLLPVWAARTQTGMYDSRECKLGAQQSGA